MDAARASVEGPRACRHAIGADMCAVSRGPDRHSGATFCAAAMSADRQFWSGAEGFGLAVRRSLLQQREAGRELTEDVVFASRQLRATGTDQRVPDAVPAEFVGWRFTKQAIENRADHRRGCLG